MLVTCIALTWPLGHPTCRKRCRCYKKMRRRMDNLRLHKVKFLVYSQRRIYCDYLQHKTKGAAPARSKQFVVLTEAQNTASHFTPSQNTGVFFYLTNRSIFTQNVSRDSGQRSDCRYSTLPWATSFISMYADNNVCYFFTKFEKGAGNNSFLLPDIRQN